MLVVVTGATGFIGLNLVEHIKKSHPLWYVRGVDIQRSPFTYSRVDEIQYRDLRIMDQARAAVDGADWVIALAANMGGIGFITSTQSEIIRDSNQILTNTLEAARMSKVERLFFPSSVCVYPVNKLMHEITVPLKEEDAIPAQPQLTYGWQKLFGEFQCRAYRDAGWLDTVVGRLHNTYGRYSDFATNRAKAPAQLCAKVARAKICGEDFIEVWGDGSATRSFMHIGDCIKGILALMERNIPGPVTLGPDEVISMSGFVDLVAEIASTSIKKVYDPTKPVGVKHRRFDHTLCQKVLGWIPSTSMREGIGQMYPWIEGLVEEMLRDGRADFYE